MMKNSSNMLDTSNASQMINNCQVLNPFFHLVLKPHFAQELLQTWDNVKCLEVNPAEKD